MKRKIFKILVKCRKRNLKLSEMIKLNKAAKKIAKLLSILLIFFMVACSPSKEFWHRKYPHETNSSLREKKGLMLLQNTYLGRNKYFYSAHNQKVRRHKIK